MRRGTGRHVKRAVTRRNIFLPQTSDRAPISGADRKLRNPFTPITTPFIRRASSCNTGHVMGQTGTIGTP